MLTSLRTLTLLNDAERAGVLSHTREQDWTKEGVKLKAVAINASQKPQCSDGLSELSQRKPGAQVFDSTDQSLDQDEISEGRCNLGCHIK